LRRVNTCHHTLLLSDWLQKPIERRSECRQLCSSELSFLIRKARTVKSDVDDSRTGSGRVRGGWEFSALSSVFLRGGKRVGRNDGVEVGEVCLGQQLARERSRARRHKSDEHANIN
jgi:hypothetical protein